MDATEKKLQRREKAELIAIIKYILLQEPDLQWLLTTPMPTSNLPDISVSPKLYREQILTALSTADPYRKPKRHEVGPRLTAIKAIADDFVKHEHYHAALTIYEVLVTETIEHFSWDEFIALGVILTGCIDGLDSCFAGAEDNQKIRLRVLQTLFAIYRFYVNSGMDLDEDIPGLLVGNTTPEERRTIANWVRSAASQAGEAKRGNSQHLQYDVLLRKLEKL